MQPAEAAHTAPAQQPKAQSAATPGLAAALPQGANTELIAAVRSLYECKCVEHTCMLKDRCCCLGRGMPVDA